MVFDARCIAISVPQPSHAWVSKNANWRHWGQWKARIAEA